MATSKKLRTSERATEMAAKQTHCIFTGPRGHLDESAKNNNDIPMVSSAKVLKIRGCYEECRQLKSLQFYRVPWPPRVRAKRAQKKLRSRTAFLKKKNSELRISPRESRRWTQARIAEYLQSPVRRPDWLHMCRVGSPRAPQSFVNMH